LPSPIGQGKNEWLQFIERPKTNINEATEEEKNHIVDNLFSGNHPFSIFATDEENAKDNIEDDFSKFEFDFEEDPKLAAMNFACPPCDQYYQQYTEHPMGEHPSRTLFVRNINSNVDDEELQALFQQYGHIRSTYTQCKHRGFVMISYYDIRHAKNAMRHLQGKVLRRRKLDIHYSIPKDNPSERDQNQGTLVVFNLDSSITNEELIEVFSKFGEVKEVRETPNKKHHKFIEFYDVRDADKALKGLNKSEIRGKKIKIEPSRPGGTRKTLINTINSIDLQHQQQQEELNTFYPSPFFPPNNSFNNSIARNVFRTPSSELSGSLNGEGIPFDNFSHAQNPIPSSFNNSWAVPSGSLNYPTPSTSFELSPTKKPEERKRSDSEEKYKYALNISKVRSGEDKRTTLMIRNIPNKYTQKLLLNTVDENHKGTYNFFYLPIDFKNMCNVGYAFINFVKPESIINFYEEFNNKKWEKFNSEKVCEIAYARIQGKNNLIANFQNSSLMSEDKKYRPITFNEDGEQEPFPIGSSVRRRKSLPGGSTGKFFSCSDDFIY
jgi:RNA recognition motif-containing protein